MRRIEIPLFLWSLFVCAAAGMSATPAFGQQFVPSSQTKPSANFFANNPAPIPSASTHSQVPRLDTHRQDNTHLQDNRQQDNRQPQARTLPNVPMLPTAPSASQSPQIRPVVHNAAGDSNTMNNIANNPAVNNPAVPNILVQHHRLRLSPQVFEQNLIKKLGSRFVPVRNVESPPGQNRYKLPGRGGMDVEIVIDQQHATVSVSSTPQLVHATLQIIRFLDTADVPGSSLTHFVPVQQANVEPARRVANLVNQEMIRVAQLAVPPAEPIVNGAAGADAGGDSFGRVIGNVNIEIIDAFGTVVIQGSPGDVAVVQEMIRQLEELSLANEPVIELVPMWHADSLRVSQLVQTLYQQVYQQRRGALTILPLVKPNTILMIGREESINAAKELISKLDTPGIPNAGFRIFPLKHAAAPELGPQITSSFTGRAGFGQGLSLQVNIVPDARTNALIVQANPRDMVEVESMIRQLDVPGGEITSFMRVFPLRNAIAADLQVVLTNALNSGISTTRGTMLSLSNLDADGNIVRSSVAYNVSVVADARNNALIVTAPPETMPLIAQLIEQLDKLPSTESRIRVFTLVNGDAFALTNLLTNIFAPGAANQVASVRPGFEESESTLVGIRFQTDVRTNSIVAIGSDGDLAIAEALLIRLDSESLNNRRVFTMKLVNTPAEEIAPILNNHINTERQIALQNTQTLLPNSPIEQFERETNIIAEPISNSLIITTSPRYHDHIRKIIADLDERPQMVAIEVLIAEVTIQKNRERGVEIGLQDSILFNQTIPPSPLGFIDKSSVGVQGITRLGAGQGGNGFSFTAANESVSLFIRALETHSRTQILARPRLVTLHNNRATIQVGESVPYEAGTNIGSGGQSSSSTEFLPIGTVLDITPRIMPDGMISMGVYVERSSLIGWETIGTGRAPHIRDTNATTTISAMDGETVVFAGLISEEKTSINNSVPGLNKIPMIKHFFENDARFRERKELVIILTPKILRTQGELDLQNRQERERLSWCTADVIRLMGDPSIRRRSDVWPADEVRHIHGTPTLLLETQLPPQPMVPIWEER